MTQRLSAPGAPLLGLLLATMLPLATAGAQVPPNFEVRVKDHREAIDDFSRFDVVVEAVRVSRKAGWKFWQRGWKELQPAVQRIDLTRYRGSRSATIFKGAISPGAFDAIHLKIREVEGILKKTNANAPVKAALQPIQLDFSVTRTGETVIVFDLVVLDMSDHPPAGYELHLRGYELYKDGKLLDRIPPA